MNRYVAAYASLFCLIPIMGTLFAEIPNCHESRSVYRYLVTFLNYTAKEVVIEVKEHDNVGTVHKIIVPVPKDGKPGDAGLCFGQPVNWMDKKDYCFEIISVKMGENMAELPDVRMGQGLDYTFDSMLDSFKNLQEIEQFIMATSFQKKDAVKDCNFSKYLIFNINGKPVLLKRW